MRLATLATVLALTALPAFAQQAPQDPETQYWRALADRNAAEAAQLFKSATMYQKQVAELTAQIAELKKPKAADAMPVPPPAGTPAKP